MRINKAECMKVFVAIGIVALLLTNATACGGTEDFTVTSQVAANHTHEITIWGTNVDWPPAEGREFTLLGHELQLTKQDFQALKKGQQIIVTSSADPRDNHTHDFIIQKPGR